MHRFRVGLLMPLHFILFTVWFGGNFNWMCKCLLKKCYKNIEINCIQLNIICMVFDVCVHIFRYRKTLESFNRVFSKSTLKHYGNVNHLKGLF